MSRSPFTFELVRALTELRSVKSERDALRASHARLVGALHWLVKVCDSESVPLAVRQEAVQQGRYVLAAAARPAPEETP